MKNPHFDHLSSGETVFILIDAQDIRTKKELLEIFSESMEFPDFFGNNLDALYDMLSDLSWFPFETVFVIMKNTHSFFKNNPGLQSQLADIFSMANEEQIEEKEVMLFITKKNND